MSQKWICQTWKEQPEAFDKPHIFDQNTEDGFCPEAPHYHGILLKEGGGGTRNLGIQISFPADNQKFDQGTSITILTNVTGGDGKVEFYVDDKKIGEDHTKPYSHAYPTIKGEHVITAKFTDANGEEVTSPPVKIVVRDVGEPIPEVALCVIMMDGSSSMADPVFKGSPLTRMKLVATTAASGIFDLERMQNNPNAYVAAFKFDDRLELMFLETIASLIYRYDRDVTKFADYLFDELFKMQQGTDINQALQEAHSFVQKFVKKQLKSFPLKQYRVMQQRILKHDSVESVSVANVRVLIYTDGMQFDTDGNRTLLPNPFEQEPIEGLNHDIVIGAFFGQQDDEGCRELQSLLSKCPIHDEMQFFLFDKPAKIGNLKYLFRMASGASGFCPKCLEKELFR